LHRRSVEYASAAKTARAGGDSMTPLCAARTSPQLRSPAAPQRTPVSRLGSAPRTVHEKKPRGQQNNTLYFPDTFQRLIHTRCTAVSTGFCTLRQGQNTAGVLTRIQSALVAAPSWLHTYRSQYSALTKQNWTSTWHLCSNNPASIASLFWH
jgi:hypothetical protein